MSLKNKCILFDIDGTLLHVKHGFMQSLIADIVKHLGKNEVATDGRSFAGRTDRDIFESLMKMNGLPLERFDDLRALYIEMLEKKLNGQDVETIDGALGAVSYFSESEATIGLLTGNFRESAFTKLSRASLDSYFSFGAFGCNHTDRNFLPLDAYNYVTGQLGIPIERSDMIIIGDTPKDIECAKTFGAVSVAVSTGNFSSDALAKHNPDILLESLNSPDEWLTAIS